MFDRRVVLLAVIAALVLLSAWAVAGGLAAGQSTAKTSTATTATTATTLNTGERAAAPAEHLTPAEAAARKAADEYASSSAAADTGTDPPFATCRDAAVRGYGPYRRGVDVEYGWYPDRDGDGLSCET